MNMGIDTCSEYEFYNDYPFLKVPNLEYVNLEYEVSDYSMEIIHTKYPLIRENKQLELKKCSRPRNQMSTRGAYLQNSKEDGIDIVADILTSAKNLDDKATENKIFKRIYHSVGNILPVCEGINTRWGGRDTAYVKLSVLKEHIEHIKAKNGFDEEVIKRVKQRIKDKKYLGTGIINKGCLKYWIETELLPYFKTEVEPEKWWKVYVEKNYLQDMVDKEYNPIASSIKETNLQIIKRGYRIMNNGDVLAEDEAKDIVKCLECIVLSPTS